MTVLSPGSAPALGSDQSQSISWQVAEEVPVAFRLNGEAHSVMMASPGDLEDFALGFAIAEELVSDPDLLDVVRVEQVGPGYRVCMEVPEAALGEGAFAKRTIAGRSSCGLCGITDMENAVRQPAPVAPPVGRVGSEQVAASFRALPTHQPMNAVNHSVHAAAFCGLDGQIKLVREDVGRHNALDKLIGAMNRFDAEPAQGFIVMTSRCSFELVQKTAAAGVAVLATLSAPTSLALDMARKAGITLAARGRGDQIVFF